ncbi:MAG TPA: DUF4287 domain-containing protein [Caulobacteraceae bacterium]|jgi:hypothetical protein
MDATNETSGGGQFTERQRKWFATVQANLEAQTGRPLDEWIEIVRRDCPGTTPRARSRWLKEVHGVGANHGAYILSTAFPSGPGWDDPSALRTALWVDPESLAVLEAAEAAARELDGVVIGQRKTYTAFSRAVQFAAMRPLKGGRALLGFKLDSSTSPRLKPPTRKESWSERLTAVLELSSPEEVDGEVRRLLALAYANG